MSNKATGYVGTKGSETQNIAVGRNEKFFLTFFEYSELSPVITDVQSQNQLIERMLTLDPKTHFVKPSIHLKTALLHEKWVYVFVKTKATPSFLLQYEIGVEVKNGKQKYRILDWTVNRDQWSGGIYPRKIEEVKESFSYNLFSPIEELETYFMVSQFQLLYKRIQEYEMVAQEGTTILRGRALHISGHNLEIPNDCPSNADDKSKIYCIVEDNRKTIGIPINLIDFMAVAQTFQSETIKAEKNVDKNLLSSAAIKTRFLANIIYQIYNAVPDYRPYINNQSLEQFLLDEYKRIDEGNSYWEKTIEQKCNWLQTVGYRATRDDYQGSKELDKIILKEEAYFLIGLLASGKGLDFLTKIGGDSCGWYLQFFSKPELKEWTHSDINEHFHMLLFCVYVGKIRYLSEYWMKKGNTGIINTKISDKNANLIVEEINEIVLNFNVQIPDLIKNNEKYFRVLKNKKTNLYQINYTSGIVEKKDQGNDRFSLGQLISNTEVVAGSPESISCLKYICDFLNLYNLTKSSYNIHTKKPSDLFTDGLSQREFESINEMMSLTSEITDYLDRNVLKIPNGINTAIKTTDLFCKMILFPNEYERELLEIESKDHEVDYYSSKGQYGLAAVSGADSLNILLSLASAGIGIAGTTAGIIGAAAISATIGSTLFFIGIIFFARRLILFISYHKSPMISLLQDSLWYKTPCIKNYDISINNATARNVNDNQIVKQYVNYSAKNIHSLVRSSDPKFESKLDDQISDLLKILRTFEVNFGLHIVEKPINGYNPECAKNYDVAITNGAVKNDSKNRYYDREEIGVALKVRCLGLFADKKSVVKISNLDACLQYGNQGIHLFLKELTLPDEMPDSEDGFTIIKSWSWNELGIECKNHRLKILSQPAGFFPLKECFLNVPYENRIFDQCQLVELGPLLRDQYLDKKWKELKFSCAIQIDLFANGDFFPKNGKEINDKCTVIVSKK